jgi:hypothetical protein
MGTRLAADNETGYCGSCTRLRRPRESDEAERTMFDAAIAAVLEGAPKRPGDRRRRRAEKLRRVGG